MGNKKNYPNDFTPRENFLMSLLNKVVKEYKALLEITRRAKPFKIVEIISLSSIPGETQFAIQITNKNCILQLTAADIISANYNLNNFNEFHAEMIKQAAQGKLIEFLRISDRDPFYKITAKRFDKTLQKYAFTIENENKQCFTHTAEEIAMNKEILKNLSFCDIYDVGHTHGSESILKEKMALVLAKRKYSR